MRATRHKTYTTQSFKWQLPTDMFASRDASRVSSLSGHQELITSLLSGPFTSSCRSCDRLLTLLREEQAACHSC